MKLLKCLLFLMAVLATGTAVAGSATVIVPGNATGGFGNPASGYVNLVPALVVKGPGTIQISYKSGIVTDAGGVFSGPYGVPWTESNYLQFPLQETIGTQSNTWKNLDALIGAFVPASTTAIPGFAPVDGTKQLAHVGISPNALFFVGAYTTVEVSGPGTLFLGINDPIVGDNGGSYTVSVTGP